MILGGGFFFIAMFIHIVMTLSYVNFDRNNKLRLGLKMMGLQVIISIHPSIHPSIPIYFSFFRFSDHIYNVYVSIYLGFPLFPSSVLLRIDIRCIEFSHLDGSGICVWFALFYQYQPVCFIHLLLATRYDFILILYSSSSSSSSSPSSY